MDMDHCRTCLVGCGNGVRNLIRGFRNILVFFLTLNAAVACHADNHGWHAGSDLLHEGITVGVAKSCGFVGGLEQVSASFSSELNTYYAHSPGPDVGLAPQNLECLHNAGTIELSGKR